MSEWSEKCEFTGPEVCEENLDEKGLDLQEEERKHFGENDR